MKKLISLFFVLTLAACVAVPVAEPQTAFAQGIVALPDDAKTLILSLLTAAIAWVLLRINLGGQYAQPIAAALAPVIVVVLENRLGLIPPSFDNIVLAIIHWLVLLVSGSVGAFVLFKRAKAPKTLLSG